VDKLAGEHRYKIRRNYFVGKLPNNEGLSLSN